MKILDYIRQGIKGSTKVQLLGKIGETFIDIPSMKKGTGVVKVNVKGECINYIAYNNSRVPIKSGTLVEIVDLYSNDKIEVAVVI